MQFSHLTHSNAIISVYIDLHAVMFAHCEHCIPFATYIAVLECVHVCVYVCNE